MNDTIAVPNSHNPFSTKFIRPGAIEFVFDDGYDVEQILSSFVRAGKMGQIVGPHGAGKSTLLRAILPGLEQMARVHWTQIQRAPSRRWFCGINSRRQMDWPDERNEGNHSVVWVIDGFDGLGWLTQQSVRWYCQRKRIGLLVTTHRDLPLPTMYRPSLNFCSFQRLALERLRCSSVALSRNDIRLAFERHAPNVREALFDLYDRYEEQR